VVEMSTEPLAPGTPAFVKAGRRVRCDRCGKVHTLVRSDNPEDDSGELYVECCGDVFHAAHHHWLHRLEPGDGDHEIHLP
jgi:hypothetical protein